MNNFWGARNYNPVKAVASGFLAFLCSGILWSRAGTVVGFCELCVTSDRKNLFLLLPAVRASKAYTPKTYMASRI